VTVDCRKDTPQTKLGEYALSRGQTLELGVIRLPRGGFLAARIRDEAGKPIERKLGIDVTGPGVMPVKLEEDGMVRAGPSTPGTYILSVVGNGIIEAQTPFELREGSTTELEVVLKLAALRCIKFVWPEGVTPPLLLEYVIRDGDGKVDRQKQMALDFEVSSFMSFVPGKYTVEASTDTGLRAEGSFTVEDLTDRIEAIEFPLR
jgi:hypothetical protein